MRDISEKQTTLRVAKARTTLKASPQTIVALREGKLPKGDPLPVAKVSAIQAAKNTHQIIPYCHPLPIEFVGVEFVVQDDMIQITVEAKAVHKTGVEMEALTAAAVAALTLYDMMKIVDDQMEIGATQLLSKSGGKSDYAVETAAGRRAAVLVVSDSVSAGQRQDRSGALIAARLRDEGFEVIRFDTTSDEAEAIERHLKHYADEERFDLVITTGGTGCGPRDNTPEVMSRVVEREVAGLAETMRSYGQARMPFAMLSRGRAGIRGNTLIVNLPGSTGGVRESLAALLPGLHHAFKMMHGGGH